MCGRGGGEGEEGRRGVLYLNIQVGGHEDMFAADRDGRGAR